MIQSPALFCNVRSQKHESSLGIETAENLPVTDVRPGSQKHESSLGIETWSDVLNRSHAAKFPKA